MIPHQTPPSDKPLPCPFCGREPLYSARPSTPAELGKFIAFISCKCGGYSARAHQLGFADTEEEARRCALINWNRRSTPPSVPTDELASLHAEGVLCAGDICEVRRADCCICTATAEALTAALAVQPGGVDVKPLDWQTTYVDRGDGQKEESGWEADNGFNQWYSVEMYFGTDSYGWQVKFDCDVIADHDDPERAKAAAQEHFASRILSRLTPSVAIGAEGQAVIDAALTFIEHGTKVTKVGGEIAHVVIESADKSDPHYALCKAVEAYRKAAPPTAQEG